jgi:hypothetical protein
VSPTTSASRAAGGIDTSATTISMAKSTPKNTGGESVIPRAETPTSRSWVTTSTKKTYTIPLANRTSVSATRSGRSADGSPRRSATTSVTPANSSPIVSSLASYSRCCATVASTPAPTATARIARNPAVNVAVPYRIPAASSGPRRNAVRRKTSVLAKPRASRSGGTDCLTTANVAPSPNDFHACASRSPTKIQPHGSIATPAIRIVPAAGATSQTRKPRLEATPNSVSATRDPIRSERRPPGYGYTAPTTLPSVP